MKILNKLLNIKIFITLKTKINIDNKEKKYEIFYF